MTWVLVALFGFAAWLAAVWFFVLLCSAAGRANEFRSATGHEQSAFVDALAHDEANVIYLSSRDRRRSLSSLPSV
jgi:hypothetical protein